MAVAGYQNRDKIGDALEVLRDGLYPFIERELLNWQGDAPNWNKKVHGGGKGLTFYDTCFQLVPECVVFETKPTGYPRAPVGKKRVWIDTREH